MLRGSVKTRWANSDSSASSHAGDGLECFLVGGKISLDPGPLLVGGSLGLLMGAYTRVRSVAPLSAPKKNRGPGSENAIRFMRKTSTFNPRKLEKIRQVAKLLFGGFQTLA